MFFFSPMFVETVKAAKAAVEMAYPHHHAKIPTSSTTRPLGNPNHQTLADKSRPHIKRNPMVKMASKDSGTGNSVESSRSNGSKDGDYLINEDGSLGGSTIDIIKRDGQKGPPFKKPLVKQASSGMVNILIFVFIYNNVLLDVSYCRLIFVVVFMVFNIYINLIYN